MQINYSSSKSKCHMTIHLFLTYHFRWRNEHFEGSFRDFHLQFRFNWIWIFAIVLINSIAMKWDPWWTKQFTADHWVNFTHTSTLIVVLQIIGYNTGISRHVLNYKQKMHCNNSTNNTELNHKMKLSILHTYMYKTSLQLIKISKNSHQKMPCPIKTLP